MKYILIATKGDITKVQIYSDSIQMVKDIESLKILNYKITVYQGVDVTKVYA